MKKALVSLAACIGIVVVGGIVSKLGMAMRTTDASSVPVEAPEQLPNVRVQTLEASDVEDVMALTGGIIPWETVTLSAETRGKIESRPIEEGDRVEGGQEIFKINTTTIEATLSQARAQSLLATQEMARTDQLRKEGISSPQDLDRARMNQQATRATVEMSEIQLAHSVIRTPFAGVVDVLLKEEGEYVDAGTPLVRLVQVDRVKVVLGLPERDVPLFETGDAVKITLDAYPDRAFEGRIHRIATTAEASTRTFVTEVELDNSEGLMKPGMIARATLVRRSFKDAVTVPMFAVVNQDDGRYALVEENGLAHRRPVELGFFQGDRILVKQGLAPGDRLIVSGQRDLDDGDPVNVLAEAE